MVKFIYINIVSFNSPVPNAWAGNILYSATYILFGLVIFSISATYIMSGLVIFSIVLYIVSGLVIFSILSSFLRLI